MFSLRTPGDDHSGPSLDVYGLLLAEMSRPIICSAVLVDGSARLARPITDEGRRSPASPHLQRYAFNLEMETASTVLEFRVDSYYITHLCLTFSFL